MPHGHFEFGSFLLIFLLHGLIIGCPRAQGLIDFRSIELDQEIPSALYAAVAEVLAYVYQLANWRQQGGNYPMPPHDIPVPAELVPEVMNG